MPAPSGLAELGVHGAVLIFFGILFIIFAIRFMWRNR
jgi:hypothetical protein